MPDDVIEVGEFGLLVERFLKIVLAEFALAAGVGLTNQDDGLGLADGQQAGVVRWAIGVS